MKSKKILKVVLISIVISIIKEIVFTYLLKMPSNYYFDRILISTIIFTFIGLHFVIEIRELYDFIIKYRYKISIICIILFTLLQYSGSSNGILTFCVLEPEKDNTIWGSSNGIRSDEFALETPLAISQTKNGLSFFNEFLRGKNTDVFSTVHAPVKDILSIGKLFNLGYFINSGIGLAFSWNLRFFLLLLVSYELFYIITNNKKYYAFIGAIVITFSGAVQWLSMFDIIICGELALVLLNKFLNSKEFKIRTLCLMGITICAITYVFTFYPPFIVAFGYVFLALGIWIIIKNRKEYKISVKDFIVAILYICFMSFIFYRYYTLSLDTLKILNNTSYPGNRESTGGNGIIYLFSWVVNPFLNQIKFEDNCVLASIISLFPIPLLFSIYYIKNKKNLSFFIPIVLVNILEIIFVIFGIPKFISNITLLSYSTVERISVAVNFANVYMLFYIISNFENKILTLKNKNIILICILVLSIFIGASVNPITKSVYGITQTDIALKIQEIVSKEDGLWISIQDIMSLSNYAVANGAKVVNSSNIYPNEEFFIKVLGNEKAEMQKSIWNRYCHIKVVFDDECYVEELSKDTIVLHINFEKIKELGIDYIITYKNIETFESKGLELEKIYEKKSEKIVTINDEEVDSVYIYKVKK